MRCFNLIFASTVALGIIGCASTDVELTESSVVSEERALGNIPYRAVSVLKVYPSDRKSKTIKGICFVISDQDSFFDRPCKNIRFQLLDFDGEIVDSQQTDVKGRFRFNIEKRGKFMLRVESHKYKTLSEEIIVSLGADILVRLIQK